MKIHRVFSSMLQRVNTAKDMDFCLPNEWLLAIFLHRSIKYKANFNRVYVFDVSNDTLKFLLARHTALFNFMSRFFFLMI